MRRIIAGLVAGLVLLVWGMLSHVVLPLGSIGMRATPSEAAVLDAIRSGLPESGVYYMPWMDEAMADDEAAMAAFSERALASPYAFVVYQPTGRDPMAMGPQLVTQYASDALAGIVAAFLIGGLAAGFGGRVLAAGALGVFSWLTISVPYWNWYRFPPDFTLANLAMQLIGWLLAGVVIALILPRRR